MQMERLAVRARGALTDGRPLRRLAGDLGAAAFRGDAKALAALRGGLAEVEADDAFVRGYRAAMADVAAAVERELQVRAQELEDEGYVKSRKHYARALSLLREGPCTGADLVRALRIDKSQASDMLAELRARELTEHCTTADADARARPHALTLRGMRVADRVAPAGPTAEQARAFKALIPGILDTLSETAELGLSDCVALARSALGGDLRRGKAWGRAVFAAVASARSVERRGEELWARHPLRFVLVNDLVHGRRDACSTLLHGALTSIPGTSSLPLLLRIDASLRDDARWLFQSCGLKGRPLEDAELLLEPPPSYPYLLVYSSEALCRRDLARHGQKTADYVRRAERVHVLQSGGAVPLDPPRLTPGVSKGSYEVCRLEALT